MKYFESNIFYNSVSCAFLVLLTLGKTIFADSIPDFKLCIDQPSTQCQQISRDQEIACLPVRSKVDCLINADRGLEQFALITAEEALLAAPLVSDNVVIFAELVPEYVPYQTVVVVRKSFVGGLENLKGLRYCHPGFAHDELITRYVLEELESKVTHVNCSTSTNETIAEKRIQAVAEFFGSSCRPGAWVEDDVLDAKLKSKYSSLCDLCGLVGCNVAYRTPFNDSLACLGTNGGDLSLTSLRDAQVFFNITANTENYQYLCSNGRLSDPSTPCTWTNQLRQVFVTSSQTYEKARTYVSTHLSHYLLPSADLEPYGASTDTIEASLVYILGIAKSDRINITQSQPLRSYVEARRRIPTLNESLECNTTIKWSTVETKEQQKCQWLQQAAINVGMQPVLQCVQSTNGDTASVLDSLQSGNADIAFIDANYGFLALQKDLTNIAYPETDTRQLSKIVIVFRANDTLNVTSLTDLKGKRVCLPEYGGKEWLTFTDLVRSDVLQTKSCDYQEIFSNFVGDSCVPGANSNDYNIPEKNSEKLCANCLAINNTLPSKYCSADLGNKYFTTDGAIRCLLAQNGDYAIISINDMTPSKDIESQIRVLNRNGTFATNTGSSNVDENAALTVITAGEVVIKNGNRNFDDATILLRDIEKEFGQKLLKPFQVFESFNGTKDLHFPDSTPGLTFGGTHIKYVDNFQKLIRTSEFCTQNNTSSAHRVIVPFNLLLTIVFVFYLVSHKVF